MIKNQVRLLNIGLKLGNVASIIGNIVYNFNTNSLRIENPIAILDNPLNYKKFLKGSINKSKIIIASTFFASLFLFEILKK